MSRQTLYAVTAVILVLLLASLACGESQTEKLAKAATPATATPVSETKASATPESTKVTEKADGPTPTSAPEKPTSTPAPTATNTPKPTPTPEPEDVVVVDSGFGQDGRSLGFAFVVSNPNAGLTLESTQYQVAAYNKDGAVVETESGYISLILPSQATGVAGTMFLDEGVEVAKLEVQLSQGDPEASDPIPDFEVSNVTYRLNEWGNKATCVIANPFDRILEDLRVSVVAYDESGKIVGGGFTFLNFVLASGTTGVETSFTSTTDVAKVEIFPAISGLTFLGSDNEIPSDGKNLMLQKYGYGQNDRSLGFGMIIENPNQGYAVESTKYHISFFDADGNVLVTEEGYVSIVLPGQVLGVGGGVSLPEGAVADTADFQILSGSYEETEELPSFTSENVVYQAGDWSSKTTGLIVSPYKQDITNLSVYAITYDEAGNVTGGGHSFLDFVQADGKAAVEVSTTCAGTPTSAELYASVSSLSDFKD